LNRGITGVEVGFGDSSMVRGLESNRDAPLGERGVEVGRGDSSCKRLGLVWRDCHSRLDLTVWLGWRVKGE